MSFSKVPDIKGRLAANSWLRNIAPDKEERKRSHHANNIQSLKQALGNDKKLLQTLHQICEDERFFGRVNGLREGLHIYRNGSRIERRRTAAFRAMMKFIISQAALLEGEELHRATSAKAVCEYLDKEIDRIAQYKTSDSYIGPPPEWKCSTWEQARKKKPSSVSNLVSDARAEALSEAYCTLMAWKTWGLKKGDETTSSQEDDD